tara:strand:+ start:823 stop:1131 length:309 start_codon:yes stop_codon:yes gene_type:complete
MVAPLFAAVLPALPSIAGSLLNLGKERKATKAARAAEQKRSLQASLQARFKVGELQRSGQSRNIESASTSRSSLMGVKPKPSTGLSTGSSGEFSGTRSFGIG